MDGLLVTFGCSWVKGKGASYREGMSRDEYDKMSQVDEINSPFAFRTLLAERNNLEHINFSINGSSNQRQFRDATKFFSSQEFEEYQRKYSTIIVLWGITSTARTEVFDIRKRKWAKIFYNWNMSAVQNFEDASKKDYVDLRDLMIRSFYDHDIEVDRLSYEMRHWNQFFKGIGVKNLWFDVLNHYDYNVEFNNLCLDYPRDLLSQITSHKQKDRFHFSQRSLDCRRVSKGIMRKTLNPHSHHPTKKGHEKIFEILDPYVKDLLPRS